MKTLQEHLDYIRAHPDEFGSLVNTIDDMRITDEVPEGTKATLPLMRDAVRSGNAIRGQGAYDWILMQLEELTGARAPLRRGLRVDIPPRQIDFERDGGRRKSQAKRFGSCVKAVRKTVKARKGSSAEGAAIAICTTALLHPRGRTIKRYRKGRLLTQKRR